MFGLRLGARCKLAASGFDRNPSKLFRAVERIAKDETRARVFTWWGCCAHSQDFRQRRLAVEAMICHGVGDVRDVRAFVVFDDRSIGVAARGITRSWNSTMAAWGPPMARRHAIQTVFVILMENHSWSTTQGQCLGARTSTERSARPRRMLEQ